ncbi:MAG: hypothetical protein J6W36_07330 [Clostridiales bacterium]|nr:hypothetical protein [Clostridiales bacterium]
MTDIILTVVWPFASALIVSLAELFLARTKAFGRSNVRDLKLPKIIWQINWKDKTGKTALSFLIIWTAALLQFLFSMICIFLVRRFANVPAEAEVPGITSAFFAVGSIVSDLCILYLLRSRKRTHAKTAVMTAVMSYALIAVELFLFNFNSFSSDRRFVTMKGTDLKPEFAYDAEDEENGAVRYTGDSIIIKKDCTLMIHGVPDDAYSVTVSFAGVEKLPGSRFKVRLLVKDKNSMYVHRTADVRKISGKRSVTLFMKPYGKIDSLMLTLEGMDNNVRIDSVAFSDRNVYGASFYRYLALFIALFLIVLTVNSRFYMQDYDPSKRFHIILLACVFLITTGATYLLYRYDDMKFDKYPLEDTSKTADIYQLAFDSSMKHIPYRDVPVSEELTQMDNPYDIGEREEKNVSYRWDFCYKDGKYYSYFGAAPIYTLYYPIYLVSHRIPNYSSTVAILGTVATAAIVMALLAAVRMYVPKINLLALLLMMPAVASASYIYYNMQFSDKYYVAFTSALAGIGFTFFFGLSAVMVQKTVPRLIMFFLSGVSLAVCAGSRPVTALCAAALLPVFFGVLLDKDRKLISRLSEAFVFVVPVITGIILMLANNHYRFGNIFDFGENYQLTVSDISSLKLTPEMFPSAINYFFFAPWTALETFPFFEPRGIIANSYEIYRNIEPSAGIFNLPFILLGAVFAPGSFVRAKGKISKKDAAIYNGFIAVSFATILFITWLDFSRGGICIRYISDFSWLFAICCAVILLRRIMRRSGRKTVYGLICLTSVLTVMIVFLILVGDNGCNLTKSYPELLEKCEDFFLFWH